MAHSKYKSIYTVSGKWGTFQNLGTQYKPEMTDEVRFVFCQGGGNIIKTALEHTIGVGHLMVDIKKQNGDIFNIGFIGNEYGGLMAVSPDPSRRSRKGIIIESDFLSLDSFARGTLEKLEILLTDRVGSNYRKLQSVIYSIEDPKYYKLLSKSRGGYNCITKLEEIFGKPCTEFVSHNMGKWKCLAGGKQVQIKKTKIKKTKKNFNKING